MKHTEQERNTYKQVGGNSGNQFNRASEEYHNNFPKISNNYSRYDPDLQVDRNNNQGGQVIPVTTRQFHNQQQGQQPNNNNNTNQN